ncbi:MAG: zinc-binding protein [Deltaproteobacteria bacterium HGW-Deltaproteobacteria-4]|nr:MAG: zinc-binding protein [Deltaproteobacteria bacterium HGW-Deltaproteobacteria-4]
MPRILLLILLFGGLFLPACSKPESAPPVATKLQVVTSLFPLYDFVRQIGGDQVEVTLLLPPGVEAHSFDPKPDDILRVNRAGLFIYTHKAMEVWAATIAQSVDPARVTIVDASVGAQLRPSSGDGDEHDDHAHSPGAIDPHLWLDFANAQVMVDNIAAAMASKDPAHRDLYLANAAAYRDRLDHLDAAYRRSLTDCKKRTLLQGGHFALGYLTARYGLKYHAAAAVNPEAEPTAATMAALVKQMRRDDLRYLFSEELVSPKLAETIAKEGGGSVLLLSAAHNVSKADFERGITFIEIMERNLKNLQIGLECR